MDLPKTPEELNTLITNTVAKETAGLISKRNELLGKLSNYKEFENIDIKALQAAATELAEIKTKQETDKGNYKKLYETLADQANNDKKTLQDQLDAQKKANAVMKKKADLTVALMGAKVVPELLDVAVTTLLDTVEIDDSGKAMVGGKEVNEYVKEWSATPVGTHFIKSGKKGGGANGEGDDNGAGEEAGWFKKDTPTYNLTKQAQLAKSNPALHGQLKKQFG